MEYELGDIELELTQGCQLKCKHCFAEKLFGAMTEQTLDNALNFILDLRKKTVSPSFSLTFTGGEPGLYNTKLLKSKVLWLKEQIKDDPEFKLIFGTNLAYPLTEEHIEIFKLMDGFSLSWDYKDRFSNIKEQTLFFKNLHILKTISDDIGITSVLTDAMIKEVTPEMLVHFMLGTGIKQFMFNRLEVPYGVTNDEYVAKRTVKNTQVKDYIYRLFKIYEKVKEEGYPLRIFELECIIDSFHGKHYNQYSKRCAKHLVHIHSNGDLTRCNDGHLDNYGNVNNGGIDDIKYAAIIKKHDEERHPTCNGCDYFEYCTGGCPYFCDDDTGCSVPTKIYDYLRIKERTMANTYDTNYDPTAGYQYEK